MNTIAPILPQNSAVEATTLLLLPSSERGDIRLNPQPVPVSPMDAKFPLITPSWQRALGRRGFILCRGKFQLDDFSFEPIDRWFSFQSRADSCHTTPADRLGRPGLWKTIHLKNTKTRVFEIPSWIFVESDEADDESGESVSQACLDWALMTANGQLPHEWAAPRREEVEAWLPPGALALQSGHCIPQGELILTPTRWALRFPITPRLSPELPPARREWLEEIVAELNQQWRMIRVGFLTQPDGPGIFAETDLSGAPHSEALFRAALEGIRSLVLSAVQTVDLVSDVTVTLRSLELISPKTNKPKEATC